MSLRGSPTPQKRSPVPSKASPKGSPTPSASSLYDVSVDSDDEKVVRSSGASVLSFSPGRNRKEKREAGKCGVTRTISTRSSQSITIQPLKPQSSNVILHHLFDADIEHLTWDYMRETLVVVMMLVTLMWVALPLYWGSLAPGLSHAPNFKAWVVDFDGGPLGAYVTESVINSTQIGGNQHLGWEVKQASDFRSIQDLAHQVVEEKAWAAIVVNPRASSSLYIARAYGDYSYDQTSAVTLYVEQARNENAVGQLVVPISAELLDTTLRQFNARDIAAYIRSIRLHPDAVETSLESPTALAGPWWKTVNLRPWNAAVASSMTVVGQIYLTVFAFILTMATYRARQTLESRLSYGSLLAIRIGLPLAAYVPISMSYAMLSVFFRAPFGTKFNSGAGFIVYVAYIYMDICALGLACEAAISVLRPEHMTFFLVSWLIVNISTPVEPPEMQVRWYRYAYGMPFYNHASAVRTVLFNTKNLLGRNAGVLIAWIVLSMITTSLLVWVKRRIAAKRGQIQNLAYDVDRPQELIWSAEHV